MILLAAGLTVAWISFKADSPQAMAERVAARLEAELNLIDAELDPLLGQPFRVRPALL